jgi:hypothetical protein
MALAQVVDSAIDAGLFEQEVATEQGALRFGIRRNGIVAEFFALNPQTGVEIPLREQPPRRTRVGLLIKLNEFRRLRPAPPIDRPGRRPDHDSSPEKCRFGCLDDRAPNSILKRPALMQMRGRSGSLAVLPQLAPLEPAHVILIPCDESGDHRYPHLDQLLTAELISDMFNMSAAASDWLFVFNSMHAGATVRHLHLQALRLERALPIEGATLRNGPDGDTIDDARFPGGGLLFLGQAEAALIKAIMGLQARHIPLNQLVKAGRAFLFPRHPDHEIAESFPYSGFAAMEMAGIVYTSSQEAFDAATDEAIEQALARTGMSSPSKGV